MIERERKGRKRGRRSSANEEVNYKKEELENKGEEGKTKRE